MFFMCLGIMKINFLVVFFFEVIFSNILIVIVGIKIKIIVVLLYCNILLIVVLSLFLRFFIIIL